VPGGSAGAASACRARADIYNADFPTLVAKDSSMSRAFPLLLAGAGALTLAACAGPLLDTSELDRSLGLGGGGGQGQAARVDLPARQTMTIGVNAFLWRAALDTLSFAPIAQTDSNGGVIVTDWYANPQNPGERVRLTVTILDRDLRADALRVAGARQTMQNGQWIDAALSAATVQRLEDIILTRARDIRRGELAR
jgi:hypothetical protein